MALASFVIRPAQPLVMVRSQRGSADRLHCFRGKPAIMSRGLVPAAAKHPVIAVRPSEDLAVPIVPMLHGGVLKAVIGVTRPYRCHTPYFFGELARDGDWAKIFDKRLGAELGNMILQRVSHRGN